MRATWPEAIFCWMCACTFAASAAPSSCSMPSLRFLGGPCCTLRPSLNPTPKKALNPKLPKRPSPKNPKPQALNPKKALLHRHLLIALWVLALGRGGSLGTSEVGRRPRAPPVPLGGGLFLFRVPVLGFRV